MSEMFDPLPGGRSAPRRAQGRDWLPLSPVPEDGAPPPPGHRQHGKASATFTYRNSLGEILGYVCRFEIGPGEKIYQPLTFCAHSESGKKEWRWKGFLEPRPLYNLDQLAQRPDAPVLLVEGEKAADAAAKLLPGWVVTTSPNGAKSAAKANWSQLARRRVAIWPDFDEAGRAYARDATKALRAAAVAEIAILEPPATAPEGWDAADAAAEGWDEARALALVQSAKPVETPQNFADEPEERPGRQRGAAAKESLLALVERAELWHGPDREAWATVEVADHRENIPVKSEAFRDWLSGEFFAKTKQAPGDAALKEAVATIAARCVHDGGEYPVFLRLGFDQGSIWLDLANDQWQAVRIDERGWEIIDRPPVKFRRPSAMRPLPAPVFGGDLEDLRGLVNVQTEGDLLLVTSWLLAALNPNIPCPILAINGEQGSAKSTTSTLLRILVDDNIAPIRSAPKDEQDFIVQAHNSHVMVLDNLSGVSPQLSDSLCRLTTGGGHVTRMLYSDRDEVVFYLKRPIILNGIPDLASRPDLADRCILLTLPAIPKNRRRTETAFWADVKELRPRLLGALLTAVSRGLLHLPEIKLEEPPRMADFAYWIAACEAGLGWMAGTMLQPYEKNRAGAVEKTIDADPVAGAVCDLVKEQDWEGTATAMLQDLAALVPEGVSRSRLWPSANTLRDRLRRHKASLASMGILIDLEQRAATKDRSRIIVVRMPERQAS